jgi:hypothetical protein
VRESLFTWARFFSAAFEGLLVNHGTPVALHRRVVGGDQLRRHHAPNSVLRTDADRRIEGGPELLISRLRTGVIHPKPLHGLEGKNVVPVIGTRAAGLLKRSHQIASIVGDHRRWLGRVRSLLSRHAAPCRFHLPAHCPSKHAIHVTFPREELPCERYW